MLFYSYFRYESEVDKMTILNLIRSNAVLSIR